MQVMLFFFHKAFLYGFYGKEEGGGGVVDRFERNNVIAIKLINISRKFVPKA
jgi:hypothetical protein